MRLVGGGGTVGGGRRRGGCLLLGAVGRCCESKGWAAADVSGKHLQRQTKQNTTATNHRHQTSSSARYGVPVACADRFLSAASVFGRYLLVLLLRSQSCGDSPVLSSVRRRSARTRCRCRCRCRRTHHPRRYSAQIGHIKAHGALWARGSNRRGPSPPRIPGRTRALHEVLVDPADRSRFPQRERAPSGREADSADGPVGGEDGHGHDRPAAGAVEVEEHSHGEQRQGRPAEAEVP